jgi:L-amino acid N-acyltransferase YncA
MKVRDATVADLPGILEIFNDAVENTTAVWMDGQEDLETRRRWFEQRRTQGLPVLVAVEGEQVLGYSSFGEFRTWPGYRHTVEHSIYVRAGRRRAGVGTALLTALIERARAHGAHAIVGGIEAGNSASIGLHQSLGFREVARMHEVGFKFGRWLDLVFVQRLLDSEAAA